MNNGLKLRARVELSGHDVEKALFEQSKDELEVSRVYDHLRGTAAKRAAEELNWALDVNAFDVLARGWNTLHAVRAAVQRSVLAPGPPAIVTLEQHNLTSTSYLVLNSHVADSMLPELKITLQFIAAIQSATLAARDGQIELVALGETSILARLKYKRILLKEHRTSVDGAPRDPFRRQRAASDEQAAVDIYL